ncbi:hypothetical protein SAMD00019534_102110 [Acytostelium subglobosum LB1]|uniref:hypothetical protein n=1 Tax=Acytostelium subglobosum LB1 TaxID=1410327 RepID=UPI000644AA78|nr:hypothetical protein SAMD00019534_102110 [Acytostelium subglobosum LB1]GAM27036.1 hypothetical protein SAMD00019534_102110 [Acytostelium subglobosum LB1]|eukprot:XP_012749916.1 hypothetical protein SAMD00019534_102110 [Acytostelium subglobosum LB1]
MIKHISPLLLFLVATTLLLQVIAAQKTTHFVLTAPCVATQTCQPFTDASVWDDPNALTNPEQYTFIVDLSALTTRLELEILTNVTVSNFICTGISTSILAFNSSSSLTSDAGQITFNSIQVSLAGNSFLGAPTINVEQGASVVLGDSSMINSVINDTLTIGTGSTVTLFHQSSLFALNINSTGTLNVDDFATLLVLGTANLTQISLGSTGKGNFNVLYLNGTSNSMLGSTTVVDLFLQESSLLTVGNLACSNANIDVYSKITVNNGQSSIRYLAAPADPTLSSIFIDKNSTFTIGGFLSQTITTQLLIGYGDNFLNVNNATITAINTTEPYNKIDTFVLQTGGFVVFANWFDFNGQVVVLPGATLDVQHHLSPTLCIEAYGQVYIHRNLTCEQGNYIQHPHEGSVLNLVEKPLLFIWKLFNTGQIVVQTNAVIRGNVISNGTIEIQADQSLNIQGYIDFIGYDSLLQIDGIAPNTNHYALTVLNGIAMNGTFKYNVSAPQLNDADDQTYKLMSTQIDFYGNFSTIVADPSLSNFTTLEYKEEAYSIELFMKGLGHPSGAGKDFIILLAVMIPLLVVTIVLTIVFIYYRKNKQYKFYSRIQ